MKYFQAEYASKYLNLFYILTVSRLYCQNIVIFVENLFVNETDRLTHSRASS